MYDLKMGKKISAVCCFRVLCVYLCICACICTTWRANLYFVCCALNGRVRQFPTGQHIKHIM